MKSGRTSKNEEIFLIPTWDQGCIFDWGREYRRMNGKKRITLKDGSKSKPSIFDSGFFSLGLELYQPGKNATNVGVSPG
jgi:hypothetical protein